MILMLRAILDCDPGIDDALAILLGLRNDKLNLEMISTVAGNAPVEITFRNARKIVEMASSNPVPVYRGQERPIVRKLLEEGKIDRLESLSSSVQNGDVSEKNAKNAVEAIVSKIKSNPREITLIATAPLTNVAEAIKREPDLPNLIKEAVIMGGAIQCSGNITPAAEFNMYVDPEAAKLVLNSDMPITLVPLDVTRKALLTPNHLRRIKKTNTLIGDYTEKVVKPFLTSFIDSTNFDGWPMHDPLAVSIAMQRNIAQTESVTVDVETKEELTRGETVADLRPKIEERENVSKVDVCLNVNVDRFFKIFLDIYVN